MVVLSVAGDWAFIPSAWKAIASEDPALGIPTTYYGAVQLEGTAYVHDERSAPGTVASILRRQLGAFQPDVDVADPSEAHAAKLLGILGIEVRVERVSGEVQVRRERRRGAPAGRGGTLAGPRSARRLCGGRSHPSATRFGRLTGRSIHGCPMVRIGPRPRAGMWRAATPPRVARPASVSFHLLLGVLAAVVAHDAGHGREPGLAPVLERFGDPTARIGVLEVVAPVGHLEGSRGHGDLEELAGIEARDRHRGRPAPYAVAIVAPEDGAERWSGGPLDPLPPVFSGDHSPIRVRSETSANTVVGWGFDVAADGGGVRPLRPDVRLGP